MYGKHYASMYDGSMVGAGAIVFAVWGYVIGNARPDRTIGTQVELNPKLLAFILGESEAAVEEAIEKLCAPDPKSRTPTLDGRKLVRHGSFSYQVVNGEKYRKIRDEEERRSQNREAQAKFRAKQAGEIDLNKEATRTARAAKREKVRVVSAARMVKEAVAASEHVEGLVEREMEKAKTNGEGGTELA